MAILAAGLRYNSGLLSLAAGCTTNSRRAAALKIRGSKQESTLGEKVWTEYSKAVERRDLKKALRILETVQVVKNWRENPPPFASGGDDERLPPFVSANEEIAVEFEDNEVVVIPSPPQDLRNLLDTCIAATDMYLVSRTYEFLQFQGLLPSFGKFKNNAFDSSRDVSPTAFLEATGLEASKLSPKKWGLTGNSALFLAVGIVGVNILLNNGVEVRPFLVSLLAFGFLDAIYLGGTGLAAIMLSWPPYKRRVFVHEAGHVLVAYLLGCPVRGVILDPVQALQLGIQGQAGTQFWDGTLEEELRQGRLTNASIDRYSMILFAGIAAEALVYGEAEGGESDENLFKSIVSVLSPPWSPAQVSNQARWAVGQSFKMLRAHMNALDIVVNALYKGKNLSAVVRDLEAALS